MAAVAPPRGIMLSFKPSDPVALKAAEPRRATAQLVSGLTRGSPTRGASPPLRVHSGIRVSPGGLARPRLAQPQRYSALAASIDMTAAAAATAVATAAIRSADGSTDDFSAVPTPAQRANTQLLAKIAACAEASVSRLTFPSAGSSGSSRRVVTPSRPASPPPSRFAAPTTTTTTTIAAAITLATIPAPAPATTPAASATTSACGSTVSTFTTASEREAATATSTTSFSPSASTASSSASSFTRTASDTASSYDSDEDYKKEEQGEDDLPLLGVSFIGNRGVFVAAGEGSAAPLQWSGMGADRAAEEDGDNNAAA
ncbi:hypothetical protein PLESTB_001581200 [Pleodorina starrii]|uniref:Uncharacterized protein n=1 Tax=Pleodorina starrii TaxID=330485 RepID=A0A9W6BXM4_9CHLO|nr:hypothetical protein PLESTB_001581200 [Pleodorina starrii]GLC66957.1 hypothetical protein PLESTF_000495900 [Pleodorina starrii]